MLKAIHHVAIICSDYSKSKYFYTQILGLKIIAENFRAERNSYKLDLALHDGSQIELFSFPEAPQRTSYPEARGLRHIAFAVDSIELFSEHLRTFHIAIEDVRVDEFTDKKYTFFSDPDGLPIELYQNS
jgi:glyoxylase I family protein